MQRFHPFLRFFYQLKLLGQALAIVIVTVSGPAYHSVNLCRTVLACDKDEQVESGKHKNCRDSPVGNATGAWAHLKAIAWHGHLPA